VWQKGRYLAGWTPGLLQTPTATAIVWRSSDRHGDGLKGWPTPAQPLRQQPRSWLVVALEAGGQRIWPPRRRQPGRAWRPPPAVALTSGRIDLRQAAGKFSARSPGEEVTKRCSIRFSPAFLLGNEPKRAGV